MSDPADHDTSAAGANKAEKDGRASPSDDHVGARIKLRRTMLGMSQERLGEGLGLTFQQVQKYERGANRVGASRLFDLSRLLDVPIGFFFDALPGALASSHGTAPTRMGFGMADAQDSFGDDPMARREAVELVRAYYRIADPAIRRRVLDLVRSMGLDTPSP